MDVYINIIKYINSYDNSKSGINWIYKIAKNIAYNYNKKSIINYKHTIDCYIDDAYIIDMDVINLRDVMESLTDNEVEKIKKVYWEDKSLREIASEYHQSLTTTQRGIKKIKDKIVKLLNY